MPLWKLLIAFSLIAWYCPVFTFQRNKYFKYFLVNSLVDPTLVGLWYFFHISCSDSTPIVIFIESLTFPLLDLKTKSISVVALLLIILNLGFNHYVEMIMCELVLALMAFSLIEELVLEFKKELSVTIFHVLLLTYFIRNSIFIYFFYTNQFFLMLHYPIFLIIIVIIPIFLTYFGPSKKIKLTFVKRDAILNSQEVETGCNLHVVSLQPSKIQKELTDAELRVLAFWGKGYTRHEIAEKLFVGVRTVDFHTANIKYKLNISSTTRLALFAKENNLNIPQNNDASKSASMKNR